MDTTKMRPTTTAVLPTKRKRKINLVFFYSIIIALCFFTLYFVLFSQGMINSLLNNPVVPIVSGGGNDNNRDNEVTANNKTEIVGENANATTIVNDNEEAKTINKKVAADKELILDNNAKKTTAKKKEETVVTFEAKKADEKKKLLSEAKKNYDALIKEQYGNYGDAILGKSPYLNSPSYISRERLKRRIQMKIIQAQLLPEDTVEDDKIRFEWVHAGNSVAAGHANLLNQTAAAILEAALQPLFSSLGIKFYAKNYAQSFMTSAPEGALCLNSIYGPNIDVFVWDFQLTDLRNWWNYEFLAQRVGIHPTKPCLFSINKVQNSNKYLESTGLAVFEVQTKEAVVKFPDSELVDPKTLPPGVAYFNCNGHMESGGDVCNDHKYNTSGLCETVGYIKSGSTNGRTYRAKWHPGWKYQQFVGYHLAKFMVENLIDAFSELYSSNKTGSLFEQTEKKEGTEDEEKIDIRPSISEAYLEYLLSLEEDDKKLFLGSEIPNHYAKLAEVGPNAYNFFHRSNSVCHTAFIPSYARYNGLVTESGQVSSYLHAGKTTYENEGFPWGSLPQPHPNNTISPWLSQSFIRPSCEHGQFDSRDCFVVRHEDNWMAMTVPNNAENKVFCSDKELKPTVGLIMVCTCGMKVYPSDYIRLPMINSTSPVEIEVNGVTVTRSSVVSQAGDDGCNVLEHEKGVYFPIFPPGKETDDNRGKYEIQIRVPKQNDTLYISGVIVL